MNDHLRLVSGVQFFRMLEAGPSPVGLAAPAVLPAKPMQALEQSAVASPEPNSPPCWSAEPSNQYQPARGP
jgi:hypothetical protein